MTLVICEPSGRLALCDDDVLSYARTLGPGHEPPGVALAALPRPPLVGECAICGSPEWADCIPECKGVSISAGPDEWARIANLSIARLIQRGGSWLP